MSQTIDRPSSLFAALRGDGLIPVFQPIVDLATGRAIGYEALARWPGDPDLTPTAVFAAAREQGMTGELDHACRLAAVTTALDAGLGDQAWLFVNAEPDSLAAADFDARPGTVLDRARRELRLMLELTERALLLHPGELLRQVACARDAGWRIALDDLGSNPDSLALLDLLMPEVIKLDLTLVQDTPNRGQARTLAAVMAHHERYGTTVLAEGIETEAHREQALACGASLGQGRLFAAPGPLPATKYGDACVALTASHAPTPDVPFDLVEHRPDLRTAPKSLLLAFSRHIEAQADNPADPPVVMTALQTSDQLTPATLERYGRLAEASPLVAVLGADVPDNPVGAVRGVSLEPDDPLVREWTVIALGTQTAVALIARDCEDGRPDLERRFQFLLTYDRDLVGRAARSLVSRL